MGQITTSDKNQSKYYQAIKNPHLLSYTYIFGESDYNCIPLAPPGRRVVINNRPKDRTSWAPCVELGWYIRPAMEHYIFHKSYIPKTRA